MIGRARRGGSIVLPMLGVAALLGLAAAASAPAVATAAAKKVVKPKPAPKPAAKPGATAAPTTAAPAIVDPLATPPSGAGPGSSGDSGIIETRGGVAHVDFSEATIEATGTKAGAVYLYERAESELLSIVRLRTSYRDELVRTVFSASDAAPKAKKGGAKTPVLPAPGSASPADATKAGAKVKGKK